MFLHMAREVNMPYSEFEFTVRQTLDFLNFSEIVDILFVLLHV